MIQSPYSDAATTAASYYDSTDADHFYADIWGGEDIHIGLYAEFLIELVCQLTQPLFTSCDEHQAAPPSRHLSREFCSQTG